MFAIIDAGAQHDEERRRSGTVIVPPATRRTDRSLPQCPRDATGCRRTREGRCCKHDEEPSEPEATAKSSFFVQSNDVPTAQQARKSLGGRPGNAPIPQPLPSIRLLHCSKSFL